MKPSEIVFNKGVTNRDKFGVYVKTRREELGINLRDLAKILGISPAYLSDIERGNRTAPLNHLDLIARELKIEDSELEFFYDIAGCTHHNWPEINEYLASNRNARKAVRLARDKGLSEEEFLEMVLKLGEESEQTELGK